MQRFQAIFLSASLFLILGSLQAEDAPPFSIAQFNSADDLKRIDFNKANVELSVGPRSVTDTKNVMKYVALKGEWPSFAFFPPKIPKDWSKHEAVAFTVWTLNDCDLGVRIDDEKSFNYNTRFNYSVRLQKGRTRVQIPIKNIAKTLDVSRIKLFGVNTDHPPSGFTLWFDDFKLGPLEAQKVDFIPYAERYDLIPSLEVVTPHFPTGRNIAGGPLNVFMLSSVKYGREVVELMQRTDLKVSLLSWDREWGANTWGFGDFYGQRGHSIDYILMQKYLDSSMQGPEKFNAMAMYTPLGWNRFTESARKAILKRVKEDGEGLVLVMPFPGDKGQPWPEDLKEVCALINSESDWLRNGDDVRYALNGRIWSKKWKVTKEHPITSGVPIEALPFKAMETQKFEVAPGADVLITLESGEPVLAVRQVGKGRVVTFATRAISLTPTMGMPGDFVNAPRYRYWEAWYNLLNRAILWAGNREFSRKGNPAELAVSSEHADPFFTARQWKDESGKVTDWELVFKDPNPTLKKFDVTAPEVIKHGEKLALTFSAPDIKDAEWTASLSETGGEHWRTLETAKVDPASGKLEFETGRVRQNICFVRIEARQNGQLLAEGRAEVALTPDPVWDEYHVFTWLEGGLPFLFDIEMKRMRELGITSNTVSPTDFKMIRTLFRGGMLAHPVGLTQGLHSKDMDAKSKKFRETKDKINLVREPSYADDAFVAKEQANVQKLAADLAKYSPLSMIMGDETALTSYTAEFDYDFHPSNIKKFQEKLKVRFGTIEALNAALNCSAKSFEEIAPPTSDEAKAAKNFGLWNEWRAHNDDMWTGAFKMYGDAMKEKYPGSRLSVSGTQEQAVFNGIDWAKLTPVFGAVCGYGGRFQELQRLCYQSGDLKVTPWGAYGRSGRAVDHQVWSSLVTGGDGMALFWWYSLRNADLTFCKSAKDYQRVIGELHRGLGKQYMQSQRVFSPVAILWSANSQRASWTLGKFSEFKKAEDEIVHAVIDSGYDAYFISEQQIAAGELAKRQTRTVVLPMSLSLGKGEKNSGLAVVPALEKLLADGGVVIASDVPAYDEYLQPAKFPEAFTSRLAKFADVKTNVAAAIAKSGAKPSVVLNAAGGGKLKKTQATLHAIGGGAECKLLTILRAPVGQKEVIGADGVIRAEPDAEGGKEIEQLEIDVSGLAGNFYDVRKKALMKVDGGKLRIDMQHGSGYPIAILPYTVEKVSAKAAIENKTLRIDCELSGSAKSFTTHILRVDVADAKSGKALDHFCANLKCDAAGKASLQLPLAIEDAGRTFSIQIWDVLSGQQTSVEVKN
ncbi:MAG TPA: hypothetical protein VEK08_15780 [Planctomycetota bacterium]|nr:hypothetical protein [Planctomycetota bacterium]